MSWHKIKRLVTQLFQKPEPQPVLQSSAAPEVSAAAPPDAGAEILRLQPDDTPWGIEMFDIRSFTQSMLSTSQDPQCATNAMSFGGDDGLGFVGQPPAWQGSIDTSLHFRIHGPLADGVLFTPTQMEHKWALFLHQQQILCVRSWRRLVAAVAHVRLHADTLEVYRIDGSIGGEGEEPGFTVRMFEHLLRTHALGEAHPTPLPPEYADDPRGAAAWCFMLFGNRAIGAAVDAPAPYMALKPLRTHSLLHIASARGDLQAMQRHLPAIGIDAPDADGRAPLHWALAGGGLEAGAWLLEQGASPDAGSDEGATPLMEAVQRKSLQQVELLLQRGAKPDAADLRGFTALHRAAEMGLADIVRALLHAGAAPGASAQGHTAASLAAMRGHADIAALLQASPDIRA